MKTFYVKFCAGSSHNSLWFVSHYLGGLEGTGHQCRNAADVSENFLAGDIGPPGQVPQDAGDYLMKFLTVRGQLGHQSLETALL